MPSAENTTTPAGGEALAIPQRNSITRTSQGDFMRPAARTRASSSTNGVGVEVQDTRICVVMVGLPARGKSLIAQKGKSHLLLRYRSAKMIVD